MDYTSKYDVVYEMYVLLLFYWLLHVSLDWSNSRFLTDYTSKYDDVYEMYVVLLFYWLLHTS